MTARNGQPDLVIFDCDGVLVDSEPLAIRIDAVMLAQYGLQLSEEQIIDRFVGRSPGVMREAIEEHLGRPLPDDWNARFRPQFDEVYENELRPIDGIEQALGQITADTCVASSSEPDRLDYKLKLTGLYERFAGRIFSASAVRNGKPAPDLFLYAAERMGVAPAACAVVEDSQYGVQAGRAAGMEVFGYAGSVTPARMLQGPATTVFDDMRDLPRLLQSR
jgi:HAD superfamily hydrolase (TIGR01509 family)